MRRVAVTVLALALAAAAAVAVPNKPVWPKQFSAPFALYDLTSPTPVVGETSQFLYHFDTDLEAQRIVYPTQCLPLLPNGSTQPCELIFVNNTVFFSQPALNKPCCTLVPGVGPIPPAFLGGFNWTSVQNAPDMYGVQHTCNYWTGSGFAYWTDATTNHDVFFNDGGSGAFWAWGKFNVTEQPADLFTLPGTTSECSNLCIFGPENALGGAVDAVAELDADDMAERDAALAKIASLRLALMSRHIRG